MALLIHRKTSKACCCRSTLAIKSTCLLFFKHTRLLTAPHPCVHELPSMVQPHCQGYHFFLIILIALPQASHKSQGMQELVQEMPRKTLAAPCRTNPGIPDLSRSCTCTTTGQAITVHLFPSSLRPPDHLRGNSNDPMLFKHDQEFTQGQPHHV